MTSQRGSAFVIVGASLAGAKAAETLRTEGYDGRIVLIGAESHYPYERPPLSKQLLRGEPVDTALVHERSFYEAQEIELVRGARVDRINLSNQRVGAAELEVGYERLLLATGARPRRLALPGAELPGIHYLRDLDDLAALQQAFTEVRHVAVVGAGWIGSEVAASARELGLEVTLIEGAATPLESVLGTEIGGVFASLHEDHGVALRMSAQVLGFEGDGRVTGVRTADGVIAADLVVVGVGVVPRTELAASAGLEIDNGVAVDQLLRTSAENVFAAGDVANAWTDRLGRRLRVEHWSNAISQGVAAARNMLGAAKPYTKVPYFFSDQYDLGMEYCGYPVAWDRVVVRGDTTSREFLAFWLAGDRVVAAMNVNIWDVNDQLTALIAADSPVDDAQLADPSVDLDQL